MKPFGRIPTLAYSIGNFAAGVFYAFNNFGLPIYLSLYTQNAIVIGWLSSTRSFEQAIIQPIVGARSDRTWTRLGRRAPFFLIGMPLSALFVIITANLPRDTTLYPTIPFNFLPFPFSVNALLIIVVATVFLFSLLFNIGADPYTALLADVTTPQQRGTVNSIKEIFGFIGQFAILIAAIVLFGQHPDWVFYIVAIGLIVGFGIVALGVREPRRLAHYIVEDPAESDRLELAERSAAETKSASRLPFRAWGNYLRDLWRDQREGMKLLGVKFFYQLGVNAAVPFLTLFVVNEIGMTGWREMFAATPALTPLGNLVKDAPGMAFTMAALLLLSTAIFALPCGLLGDRFGKKLVLGAGLLILGVFGLLAAFATSIPQLMVYLIFLGLGNAAQTVLFFPLLSTLIPPERVGEFQGLSATAETGGVAFSVLIAGALINRNPDIPDYRSVFIVTGLFLLAGFFALQFVKPPKLSEAPITVAAPKPAAT